MFTASPKPGFNVSATNYAKCLLSPYEHACRIPTVFDNKSSLLKTKRTFSIRLKKDAAEARKFAFFVQPKLGRPDNPSSFQVGMVDFSNSAAPPLDTADSYVKFDSSGQSLTMDPNTPWITQPKPSAFGIATTPTTGGLLRDPKDWGISNGATGELDTFTYGARWHVRPGSTQDTDALVIPPGSYFMVVRGTVGTPVEHARACQIQVVGGANDDDVGKIRELSNNGFPTGGTVKPTAYYSLEITERDSIRFSTNPGVAAPNLSELLIIILPLNSPRIAFNANYGIAEMVRPVGMSVLTTCVLPQLVAGGTIYSTRLAGGSMDKVLSGSWLEDNGFGSFNDYFRGNLAEGNYTWWAPSCLDDTQFYDVQSGNAREYPMILVKGTVPTGITYDATSGWSDVICLVTVEFVYEILQNTQLLDVKRLIGDVNDWSHGIKAVAGIPAFSENPKHSQLLRRVENVLSEGAKFIPLISQIAAGFL